MLTFRSAPNRSHERSNPGALRLVRPTNQPPLCPCAHRCRRREPSPRESAHNAKAELWWSLPETTRSGYTRELRGVHSHVVPPLLVPDDPGVTGAVTTNTSRTMSRLSLSRTKAGARRPPSAVERALACSPLREAGLAANGCRCPRFGACRGCQWPSSSPQLRPRISPLVAIFSPHWWPRISPPTGV